jgi:pimeloyl-ACP methyl ester carboxylesterase
VAIGPVREGELPGDLRTWPWAVVRRWSSSADVADRLARIPTPTLVAYGARDYFWPLEMVTETAARMPRARLVLYGDLGHALPLAREFVRDVIAFLRARPAA